MPVKKTAVVADPAVRPDALTSVIVIGSVVCAIDLEAHG
jgi:hypothetical protein